MGMGSCDGIAQDDFCPPTTLTYKSRWLRHVLNAQRFAMAWWMDRVNKKPGSLDIGMDAESPYVSTDRHQAKSSPTGENVF